MKSKIFLDAIKSRNKIRFYYGLLQWYVEPYLISRTSKGKVLYAKVCGTNEVRKFDFKKISNIKVYNKYKFSPVIPIIPLVS